MADPVDNSGQAREFWGFGARSREREGSRRMNGFVPPSVEVSVTLVTTYSVAVAIAVNAVGFVVASFHYSRLGVDVRHLSLPRIWGAGLSFSVLTVFFVHIGFASHYLLRSPQPSEAFWYSGVGFFFLYLLAMFLLRRPGVYTYGAACALIGGGADAGFIRADYLPVISIAAVKIAWPAVGFVTLLCFVWAYTVLVYPNLSASLGGAAPHPVRLALQPGYEYLIARGSRVYEVLGTDTGLFVEVALPEGARHKPRADVFWFRRFDPPAIYLQIPRPAVKFIEYTDTFDLAPAANAELQTVQSATTSESPRTAGGLRRQLARVVWAVMAAAAGIGTQAPVGVWTRVGLVSGCALVALLVHRASHRRTPPSTPIQPNSGGSAT